MPRAGARPLARAPAARSARRRGDPLRALTPTAGADEDFARALGGSAPGSGEIVQIKGSGGGGGGSAKKGGGGGGGGGGGTPDASLYKRQGGKKQKTPGGKEGGRSAKKHKKG